jgi:uncharacterized repeat protein (TIGR03803 family)
MRQTKLWFTMSGVLAVVLMLPAGAMAANYKVLHQFKGRDGANPGAGFIFDGAGNLYGTTSFGGAFRGGTVFELTPNSNGSWKESLLYSFCSLKHCADGYAPFAELVFDRAGNLYGTTRWGGTNCIHCGTVFSLTPSAGGSWTERVLHSFNGNDGTEPDAKLIFDAEGRNLYGTTSSGGSTGNCKLFFGCGEVFELAPNSDGTWTENVLYLFCSLANCADGSSPFVGLTIDAAGNLYGTTQNGGTNDNGVAFKLAPSWTESVLHSFTGGPDGGYPDAILVFDTQGNLYGTTFYGGAITECSSRGCGVVFKLAPQSDGTWTESVPHIFQDHPSANPDAGLIFDATGNLYGTTESGGTANCNPNQCGTVFQLVPRAGGGWRYDVLHVFQGSPAQFPRGSLVLDKAGNLFGTTQFCGSGCQGVVFEVTP